MACSVLPGSPTCLHVLTRTPGFWCEHSVGREEVTKQTGDSLSIVPLAEWQLRRDVTKGAVVPHQLHSHWGQGEGWQHAEGPLPPERAAGKVDISADAW